MTGRNILSVDINEKKSKGKRSYYIFPNQFFSDFV
jgi:hypothetical protein